MRSFHFHLELFLSSASLVRMIVWKAVYFISNASQVLWNEPLTSRLVNGNWWISDCSAAGLSIKLLFKHISLCFHWMFPESFLLRCGDADIFTSKIDEKLVFYVGVTLKRLSTRVWKSARMTNDKWACRFMSFEYVWSWMVHGFKFGVQV